MHAFERLVAWQKAHELTLRIFRATDDSAAAQYPEIAHDLRRASLAIATSIAEGTAIDAQRKLARYVDAAIASTAQLQYLIRLAADLGSLSVHDRATLEARTDEVARMLAGLRRSLRGRRDRPDERSGDVLAVAPGASE